MPKLQNAYRKQIPLLSEVKLYR